MPRIISVDDHILEPPDLWLRWPPARLRDDAPRLLRTGGRFAGGPRGRWEETGDGGWADIWTFQG